MVTLNYKGYKGSVDYSSEDNIFHGKLEEINGLVTFEGEDADNLIVAFREAVEDYIKFCKEKNI